MNRRAYSCTAIAAAMLLAAATDAGAQKKKWHEKSNLNPPSSGKGTLNAANRTSSSSSSATLVPILLIPRGESISDRQRAELDRALADVKAWYTRQLYPRDLRWGALVELRGKKTAAHYLKDYNVWNELPAEIQSKLGWNPWAGGKAGIVMGVGLLGWAGGNGRGNDGLAIVGLESLVDNSKCAGNWWCTPEMWRGTVIHETGHVLTLPHSQDPSIMAFHGGYQHRVLLPDEKKTVRGLPFAQPEPICGQGLYCRRNPRAGADACRQSNSAKEAIFCCPPGSQLVTHPDRGIGEYCAAVPVCGRGLYCSGSPLEGGSACRQDPNKSDAIYCCPKGQQMDGNRCVSQEEARKAAVTQIYRDVLNREPDAGGLNSWSKSKHSLEKIRDLIAHSKESQNNLHGLYKKYLCRRGEPAGMENWQQQLGTRMTFKQVDKAFYDSKEAQKLRAEGRYENGVCVDKPPICGRGLYCAASPVSGGSSCRQDPKKDAAIYCCPTGMRLNGNQCVSPRVAAVAQIYRDVLNREPDAGGLNSWSKSNHSLDTIRKLIARSAESQNKLHGLYKKYLCRRGEPAGMEHWQEQLGTRMTFKQVDKAFYDSKEAQGLRAAGHYKNGVCAQ